MVKSKIIYSHSIKTSLKDWFSEYETRNIFIATEANVNRLWEEKIDSLADLIPMQKIILPPGENNKTLDSVSKLWEFLSNNGADRKSLLINIGGGMLTDLAGFAASTFKRGINFINVPTTLLSQVDASAGGKTGINFNGLKNEIGTFREPIAVIINTEFLKTLDRPNFNSGFAEMIKHGLIRSSDHLEELQQFDPENIDYTQLQTIVSHSLNIKKYFAENDPTEKNIRKSLNFGHTVGHAFESMAMEQNRPVLHGYAVAWGIISELYLSMKKCGLDKEELERLTGWLLNIYGKFEIGRKDDARLIELMMHDKKNEAGKINFSLISKPGKIIINNECETDLILESLDYFRIVQQKI
jgi:3-dehydroquinate synthase